MNTLKENDPDRYLLSFFVRDGEERNAIISLDLLNLEIARLKDIINIPHMGLIRLQWWKDEIKKIFNRQIYSPHVVLQAVSKSLTDFPHLQYESFDCLISAREQDFYEDDHFDIETYAEKIHAPLLEIKARILEEKNDPSPLAQAYALTGLLRSIPFYKARLQILLPQISPDSVRGICEKAEKILQSDKTTHRYFKAHRVLTQLYLAQLKQVGYNPEKLYPLPFKELRLWWGTR